jgi:ElaB/YqjD/DUF883 family membrane-anchored ribosome-binding protein
MNLRRHSEPAELQARLVGRFATKVRAALAERAEDLPHDVNERLRVARDQAVARAREALLAADRRRGAGAPVAVGRAGDAALLAQPVPFWQRAASFLPLLMLVLGFILIQYRAEVEQVHAAAEVDSQLLKDVLPPDAYSDPGFAEYLRRSAP